MYIKGKYFCKQGFYKIFPLPEFSLWEKMKNGRSIVSFESEKIWEKPYPRKEVDNEEKEMGEAKADSIGEGEAGGGGALCLQGIWLWGG